MFTSSSVLISLYLFPAISFTSILLCADGVGDAWRETTTTTTTKKGLPSTKLHTLVLDHHNVKLTWFIDWPKKEVLFNVDEAFTDDTDWFSFGFSQRGQIEGSDVCFFVRNIYDESYNEAIVSRTTS